MDERVVAGVCVMLRASLGRDLKQRQHDPNDDTAKPE